MEMLNDSQNEMEFQDDSRSTISPISSISSISTSSIDTSSTCERKQKNESNIQVYTSVRQVTKRELAQNFSIHNDYEHPEYKSLKNSIRIASTTTVRTAVAPVSLSKNALKFKTLNFFDFFPPENKKGKHVNYLLAPSKHVSRMVLNKLPVPSLRQMALVKIAVVICNDHEIRAVVKEYGSASFVFPTKESNIFLRKPPTAICNKLKQLEINECQVKALMRGRKSLEKSVLIKAEGAFPEDVRMPKDLLPSKMWERLVRDRISKISLPRTFRDELFVIVRILTFEIDNWVKDHSDIIHTCSELLDSLQWKARGKIDRKKTAETLVLNEDLRLSDRYSLSCLYCLELESFSLWNRMSTVEKKDSWTKTRFLPFWFVNDWDQREGNASNNSCFEWIYLHTPLILRKTFTEFFRKRKLKYLKNGIFWRTIEYDDLLFCLSEIDASKHEEIFKTCAGQVLEYLLDWPLQNDFVEVADRLWSYLTADEFRDLLETILFRRIMVGWTDYDYLSLLKEFWNRSPDHYKELIRQDDSFANLLIFATYHSSDEPFPTDILLEHFKEEYLMFKYQGVKYCMFKKENSCCGANWQNHTFFEFNKGCKRVHGILFSNIPKSIQEQVEQSE
ncbi:uncharacterized protein NPIL_519691 [Nephila pilipes]|uniref:Uncharacterized protein n=1 Tax=Nephila pilipes TaxID=299642 RepID=A0A8X6NPV2_NEPPI|nr:uncharacterized protein NPIL_519691 [Nephila pilipes]